MQKQVPKAGKDYVLRFPRGIKELSWSQIETYMSCPRKYYYSRVLGLPEVPGQALLEGGLFAKVLEHELLLRSGAKAIKKLNSVEERAILHWPEGLPVHDTPEGAEILRRIVKFADRLLSSEWKLNPDTTLDSPVEYEFHISIAGVPIHGFIDLVEETFLGDFKLAAEAKYYNPATSMQLGIYHRAVPRPTVGYIVCEKKTGNIELLKCEWKAERDQQVDAVVANAAAGISCRCWMPHPTSRWCTPKFCSFWDTCDGHL